MGWWGFWRCVCCLFCGLCVLFLGVFCHLDVGAVCVADVVVSVLMIECGLNSMCFN